VGLRGKHYLLNEKRRRMKKTNSINSTGPVVCAMVAMKGKS